MKKYLLLIALLAGCNFAFTACSDDDNADEIDTEAAFSEEAMAAYCALSQLCEVDELPSNWQSYTAEPTYGYAVDASNPYVRTVYIGDIIEAEDCFRSLGGTIESGQASATYTAGNISYVYTVKNQSDLLATIDCSVPQVPHLTQIRFVPSEVQEENGLFGFSWPKDKSQDDIYYSFGDIIEYQDVYWVCVRPAIQGVKHKTHWMAIGARQNIQETRAFQDCFCVIQPTTKHGKYRVPTKLSTDVTCIRNLMILFDALAHPKSYGEKAQKYALGVGGERKEISKFINPTFFSEVKDRWGSTIYRNLGLDLPRYTKYPSFGYSIFYKGYSSWGVTMTLWTLNFSKDSEDAEINPDKNIQEVKLNWSLSKLPANSKLSFTDYCSGRQFSGRFEKKASNCDIESIDANLPEHGFFVKDICFDGDPYSKINNEDVIQRYIYKDNAYENNWVDSYNVGDDVTDDF